VEGGTGICFNVKHSHESETAATFVIRHK